MEAAELVCALLEAGLSQEQIAKEAQVHQTTVSKLARGDIKDTLSKTYRALLAVHARHCTTPAIP